ncbi:uncharacterized protein B0T23DRAFT_164225 [Neurospora hispaniola]|uniref:Uncharacterized protein n=1 Tax=Neurospora hispaniola TaxID=588809 RepID=A0AAJ0I5W9_9PEZI|nr:hypothetical protein B0T23DRAFT_164225 [Neurospora hispaniola]
MDRFGLARDPGGRTIHQSAHFILRKRLRQSYREVPQQTPPRARLLAIPFPSQLRQILAPRFLTRLTCAPVLTLVCRKCRSLEKKRNEFKGMKYKFINFPSGLNAKSAWPRNSSWVGSNVRGFLIHDISSKPSSPSKTGCPPCFFSPADLYPPLLPFGPTCDRLVPPHLPPTTTSLKALDPSICLISETSHFREMDGLCSVTSLNQ